MKENPQNHGPEAPIFAKLCREVNRKLSAGVMSERILDFIFESISFLIPYDRMGIALLEDGDTMLRLSWVRSRLPVSFVAENYSAPVNSSSLKRVIETGEPRILNDLEAYLRDHPNSKSTKLILRDGIHSSLTCPLRANNRAIGIVFFSSAEKNTYKKEHISLFQDIADELAVVIEQGRLRHLFDAGKKQFLPLARIIHDLRTPLTVIHGYIDLASRAKWFEELSPEVRNTFLILRRHATYMKELLCDIAEIKKIGEALPAEGRRTIPIRPFLEEMGEYGRAVAARKEIRFQENYQNLPETAAFNPVQIRRVLDNLFSNAVKFSRRGTTITFFVRTDPNRLIFSVRDEGPGIPDSEIPTLFKEFTKTSVRPTEGELSTGLGLAIAKSIVELHGGEISVSSKEGRGSEFTFWLPVEERSGEGRTTAVI